MIFEEYGIYTVVCEECGEFLENEDGDPLEFETWNEAKQGLDDAGWKTTKVKGDWGNLCKGCQI